METVYKLLDRTVTLNENNQLIEIETGEQVQSFELLGFIRLVFGFTPYEAKKVGNMWLKKKGFEVKGDLFWFGFDEGIRDIHTMVKNMKTEGIMFKAIRDEEYLPHIKEELISKQKDVLKGLE